MTMIQNELLRCKRAQAVPQQNVWLSRVLVLRDNSQRNHILDKLVEAGCPKVTEAIGRFRSQAMTAMIVSVNRKLIFNENFGQLSISANMLTKSVGDLNHSANVAAVFPFHTGDRKPVSACEVKSLRCAHS